MTTALDIITEAIGAIGLTDSGETLGAAEAASALRSLNALLDTWRNERLMCYALKDESLTLVSAQASYTIGPAGDLNTTRPVKIEGAYVRDASGNDYAVELLTPEEYAAISDKSTTSDYPDQAYYQPTMATGTLFVYPVPTLGYTLHILTWTPFTAFAALSTAVSLPPGYEEAMIYNLAIRLAPKNGVSVPADVRLLAGQTKATIKRINAKTITATTDLAALLGAVHHNIISGE